MTQLSRTAIMAEIRDMRVRLAFLEDQVRLMPVTGTKLGELNVYVDGSFNHHTHEGSAAVVVAEDDLIIKQLSQRFSGKHLCNNLMELEAAIAGVQHAPSGPITIISDSQYVVNGVNTWMEKWEAAGWKRLVDDRPVPHTPYWKRLQAAMKEHDGPVSFRWVKGHAKNPGNEKVDKIAVMMRRGRTLQGD